MTEIEVKLSMDAPSYSNFITHFALSISGILRQQNIFFNTKEKNLKRTTRLRSIESAEMGTKWVFTTKGAGKMVNGIATRSEIESEVSEEIANKILTDTKNLYKYVPQNIAEAISEASDSEFMIIGNFLSVRRVVPIGDMIVEADECTLPNGEKYYEIEVESKAPLIAKENITRILTKLKANFWDSKQSKFGRLLSVPEDKRINLDL